jgi:hypothetical protein
MNVNPTSADFKFPDAKRGKCPKFAERRIPPPALSAIKHKTGDTRQSIAGFYCPEKQNDLRANINTW